MKKIAAFSAWLVGGFGTMALGGLPDDGVIQPGLYRIHNHPDGAVRTPYYGLRLDELYNVTTGHDVWTFDFDAPGSNMFMRYLFNPLGQAVLHIYGTTFGGLDIGSVYHATHRGFFDVDFTYTDVTQVPGDDDLFFDGANYANDGSITPLDGDGDPSGPAIGLYDFGMGYSFRLGDESHDNGHRGFDGVSGWGWMNYQAGPAHVYSTDWLFTVEPKPVPAPGAVALGALGLFLARAAARRKVA